MENTYLILGFVAFFGASIGSFLTLATYRLPRDMKIGGRERSRCPACGTQLTVRDLVPILSWGLARGRCRHCRARVSVRYPLTELACAAGAAWLVAAYGLTLEAVALVGLWWCVVAIIITDLEHYIILDEVQVAVVLFGALYHYALGTPAEDVIEAGVFGLLLGLVIKYGFLFLRNKDGLGLGDVKLLCGVGVWFAGLVVFVPYLFIAGVLGVLCGVLWRALKLGAVFPFGPALALTLFLFLVWPELPTYFWHMYGRV